MNIRISGGVLVVVVALSGCRGPKCCFEVNAPVLPYEIIKLYPVSGGAPDGMCLGVFYVPRWVEDFTRGTRVVSDPARQMTGIPPPRDDSYRIERDLPAALGCDWRGNWQGEAYDPRRSVLYVVGETNSIRTALAHWTKWVDAMTNHVVAPSRSKQVP